VPGDVLGGQYDGAVSGAAADGERAVGAFFGDGPEFAIAYGFAVIGGQLSVVASGGDDVADVGALITGDGDAVADVNLADAKPSRLDGQVDCVNVIIR
jgi:hypothetical protein